MSGSWLKPGMTYNGDCTELMKRIHPDSVDLSVWSPPYHVGKDYEAGQSFEEWKELLRSAIACLYPITKPGGFMCINIADILSFPDSTIPRIQADVVSGKRCKVTRDMVLNAKAEHPDYNRYQLAALLGCSEQTVQRRLEGNNIRGGKQDIQTRVFPVTCLINEFAMEAGFVLYDRRIWHKDPAWANSRWASTSYRSVDEFEYIFIYWKPGITRVDRSRLKRKEWSEWGSRGVWEMASVRLNDDHQAKFPIELPLRLIRMLTDPGQLVLDPFMGSGTTAVAAIQSDRSWIGIELDKGYTDLANTKSKAAQYEQAGSGTED